MTIAILIGAGLILIAAAAILMLAWPLRRLLPKALRAIQGVTRLRRALGLAVEDGKRIHVALGQPGLTSTNTAAGLVGLSTLERIAQVSMVSDRPPVATAAEGTMAILSQDVLRVAYRDGNAAEQYDPSRGRMVGVSPYTYVAGALPVVRDEQVAANVIVGGVGPEAAYLCQAADGARSFTLAASDSLPAQAVLFAAAQEPLVGEELYALPAYLQATPAHVASLVAQDILRWLIIVLLVVGAVLKMLGVGVL